MRAPVADPTLSIRMVWPFARLLGEEYFTRVGLLSAVGVGLEEFGDPDKRVSHATVSRALETAVQMLDDPVLGLRAGQLVDPSDFDILEYAARSAENLGESMRIMTRYLRIMDEAADYSIVREGNLAALRITPLIDEPFPPAMNDYIVAAALEFAKRNGATYRAPEEIRLMHERPAYADSYARFFDAPVVFGAPHDEIVMLASMLDVPMLRANAGVAKAFELQAAREIEKLRAREGVSGKVREVLAHRLGNDAATMNATAKKVGMGVATLRRKLDEEGTTFSKLVDELREEVALRHLSARTPTISEVAFLLGFSDVRAFARAFRRWTGTSPREYRASHVARATSAPDRSRRSPR